jgi:hypothetical protein
MAQKKSWILNILGKPKEDAAHLLDIVARNRTPINVEIEGSLIRFKSQLSLKDKAVVIARPVTLGNELKPGGFVRIRWPGAGRREMRLEIAMPHFNMPNGSVGFVCRTPDGSSMPKRNHERYDVSRYSNMRLEVGAGTFRVLDLCVTGCRVAMTADTPRSKIVMGKEVQEAILIVGKDSKIVFERLIPRSQRKGFVGCEFKVKQDGKSPKVLAQVLKSVETRATDLLQPA